MPAQRQYSEYLFVVFYVWSEQSKLSNSTYAASMTELVSASVRGMSCPSWQWHRTGYRWSPVPTQPVAPLLCDLGYCSRTVVVIKLRRISAFLMQNIIVSRWAFKYSYPEKNLTHGGVGQTRYLLYSPEISPSQPHRGDCAGLPNPIRGEGLVYSLRCCWDQRPSIAWPHVERPVSERLSG